MWHRGYDYAEDGKRLEKTSLPGDDVDDPGDYSESYTHDAHGSMTAMPSIPGGLTWDPQDRLIETDLSGGGVVYYVYDSAGMRVRKVWVNQSGTTSKERYYLGAWETYRETTDLLGTPTLDLERETLHVDDAAGAACLIETKTVESATPIGSPDSVLRYQHHNHLGTATLELTGDAEVISYEEYHPYGTSSYRAANSGVDVSPKRYRYTGKERDEETGFYYQGHRYLMPWLGRWNSADPKGIDAGPNRYVYAKCDPIVYHDPFGTSDEPSRMAIGEPYDYASELSKAQRPRPRPAMPRLAFKGADGTVIDSATLWDNTVLRAYEYKEGARLGLEHFTTVSQKTLEHDKEETAKAFVTPRMLWRQTGQGRRHQFEIYMAFGAAVGATGKGRAGFSPLTPYDLAHEEKHVVIAHAVARKASAALQAWYKKVKNTSISPDAIFKEVERRRDLAQTVEGIANLAFDLENRTLVRLSERATTPAEKAETLRRLDAHIAHNDVEARVEQAETLVATFQITLQEVKDIHHRASAILAGNQNALQDERLEKAAVEYSKMVSANLSRL